VTVGTYCQNHQLPPDRGAARADLLGPVKSAADRNKPGVKTPIDLRPIRALPSPRDVSTRAPHRDKLRRQESTIASHLGHRQLLRWVVGMVLQESAIARQRVPEPRLGESLIGARPICLRRRAFALRRGPTKTTPDFG
jgi:hypothetical protein